MKARRLALTVIFLLSLSLEQFPAAGNDAMSAIREITSGYANSSRKNQHRPPQSQPAPEQKPAPEQRPAPEQKPAPAQQQPAPAQKKPAPAQKKPAPAQNNKAKNIYTLFMKVNPKLDSATAKKYADIIIEVAAKFKQDPYVIAAIIVHESTVNNKAVSKGGDYGLMQVRWKVHEKAIKQRFPNVRKANDIFDARTNITFGTEIFADCMKRSDNDVAKGLMRYSSGSTKLRDKVMATVKELRSKD